MRNLLTIAALLTVAGCGGEASEAAPKPSPVAQVSIQTTCDRVFSQGPGERGLWGEATTIVQSRAEGAPWDEASGAQVHDQLKDIAASSEATIRPHLEEMAAAVDGGTSLDVGDYKTSGTEVANVCAPYVAG